jgi:hypothetical protein
MIEVSSVLFKIIKNRFKKQVKFSKAGSGKGKGESEK